MGNNNNGLLIYRPYSTCKSEKFINLIYKKNVKFSQYSLTNETWEKIMVYGNFCCTFF